MKKILPFLIILAVLGVALGSAWYMQRSSSESPKPSSTTPANTATSSSPSTTAPVASNAVPGAEPAHKLGPDSAPVHLEEFGDYQCPPCGIFHPILQEMKRQFGDQLQVTFREFPLAPAHEHAIAAASAAEAAGLQGKFWEMHDLLYEHQKDWKDAFDVRPIFEGYAKQIGINVDRYKQDVDSEQVARRITQDGNRGHSLGVKGTPTVFMNGREVPFESLPADKLRVLIQLELSTPAR
ncbi:MAG TPA: thioredoxin domain-containing protein [Pyrinomonadaceae bacterium]|nr:thioredoxin domain-containing protein [Pyrinomonadaceae bacterium]